MANGRSPTVTLTPFLPDNDSYPEGTLRLPGDGVSPCGTGRVQDAGRKIRNITCSVTVVETGLVSCP